MRKKVEKALEGIRPYLQFDGGDIELLGVTDDGVVRVRLLGACSGCPFSQHTMQMSVEKRLKEEVPGITKVEAIP